MHSVQTTRIVHYSNGFVNHFYAMRPRSYQIRLNNANKRPFRLSRSFKVIDFVTNRKLIHDFLILFYQDGLASTGAIDSVRF